MKNILLAAGLLVLLSTGCKKYDTPSNVPTAHPYVSAMTMGADVSWLTEMEDAGKVFYDTAGVQKDCIELLKTLGVKAIRLRVWVNPTSGYNNLADVTAKAKRVQAAGLGLMIDFHYSDTWADPANQTKPAAWASLDVAGLQDAIYQHTYSVLNSLKGNGITPKWVQVGNETNNGMLWPEGQASSSMANFASFINAGYNAVKAVDSAAKVIVHLSNGYDTSLFRWMFDGLTANNAKYDVIGMSLYPDVTTWQSLNKLCEANMQNMIKSYNKEVMLCEIGMPVASGAACKRFIEDLTERVYNLPDHKGLGMFYWEPQAYSGWQGYLLGAFNTNGTPTSALEAFN
ncbi:arabinogalactan endo-1,4-beta-galactosidase [Filimonas lacunae]|uniref:Arabinogalactan endo-beta-1,4-galactanase n=1 Tax=Filimonas lacunae TaxID=477680 RepID=A0A173MN06_9BACT|nr:glycosyl hydrolase 53 family protein [Filimonas lacunae]BAV09035.1 arabinogalactan endo-1,4-beta-galactosidase [Filimonas lacunae]SIS66170.1 arabinogalactan endo-1,4-beta-galactosidase [Filimonas lacunae]